MRPDVSVVVPAHRNGAVLAATIDSLAATRRSATVLEVVIADDLGESAEALDDAEGSNGEAEAHLRAAWPHLARHDDLHLRIAPVRRSGTAARIRNIAAERTHGDVLLVTGADVRFPPGWDQTLRDHVRDDRIVAGAIRVTGTPLVGYGRSLHMPGMRTTWNTAPPSGPTPVPVAAGVAIALPRSLYARIGGYDERMTTASGADRELSVRAWLAGAEVVLVPSLMVEQRLDPNPTGRQASRLDLLTDTLRLGLLHGADDDVLELLRHVAVQFPDLFSSALGTAATGGVWGRRAHLEACRIHTLQWLLRRFEPRPLAAGLGDGG